MPEEHLSGDSKDVIRLATALIGTMSAVVLALLFASTRTSYEATSTNVSQLMARLIELDHTLQEYGPQARPLRAMLRGDVVGMVASIWQDDPDVRRQAASDLAAVQEVVVLGQVRQLTPADPVQANLQARALSIATDIEKIRLTLLAQPPDSLSRPFVAVLVIWLCFIFASFSMSSKANPTLAFVLVVCAFAASSAIYLILELGQPFDGLLQIPNAALRHALPLLPKA